MNNNARIGTLAALIAALLAVTVTRLESRSAAGDLPGARDLIHYYAATQLFLRGDNPYDLEALRQINVGLGRSDTDTVVQWIYPSWVLPAYLLLFAPMAMLPYPAAVLFWALISIAAWFAAGLLAWRAAAERFDRTTFISAMIATVFFVPAYDCILHGQMSTLIAAGISAFLFCYAARRDWLAGVCLLFPATKPTVWYLLVPVFGWLIICERRWKIVTSFSLAVVFFTLCGELVVPGLTRHWLDAIPYSAGHVLKFRNPTLVDLISNEIFKATGTIPEWPLKAVPLICSLASLIWIAKRKTENPFFIAAPVLMISVVTAPYSWFFDQSALVIGQVVLAARHGRRTVLILLAALQLGTFLVSAFLVSDQFYFWWFPVALLGIWIYASLTARSTADSSSLP